MKKDGFSWGENGEWLLTNGLGGYASSTITGLNTRKYHGLLIVAFSPEDRRVLLSKIDETVSAGGGTYKLFANQFPDKVDGDGCSYLNDFSSDPLPRFIYKVPGAEITKTICMARGENSVLVEYGIKPLAAGVRMSADFLATSRDHHWVLQNPFWDFEFKSYGQIATLTPRHEKPPVICIGVSSGELKKPEGDSRVRLFYRREQERGYPGADDLFIGARLELAVPKPTRLFVACSADFSGKRAIESCRRMLAAPSACADSAKERGAELVGKFSEMNGVKATDSVSGLVRSSDDFVISKNGKAAIVAGYPFFGEWGRDSLISLPGLLLTTGRKAEAEEVLLSLMGEAQGGLLPNNFAGGRSFNSIDTTLWMFWAVWKYLKYTGDYGFVQKRLWMGLKKLIKSYSSLMDSDSLIKSDSQAPATWMDAVVDGLPVTLRRGKPVEVEALWHNALTVCAKLAERFGERSEPYANMAAACRESFNSKFVNREGGYLYDTIDGENKDASVRPNALLAVSLDFPVLGDAWRKRIVDMAEKQLLTPYGLRSLSPGSIGYKASSGGSQSERDRAYQQGDAWPWLLGAFVDAYSKAYPDRRVGGFLKPLLDGRNAMCAGKVCELYDGSEPYTPNGCISQAWSTAELMRALAEHQDRL